jgi:malate synthase
VQVHTLQIFAVRNNYFFPPRENHQLHYASTSTSRKKQVESCTKSAFSVCKGASSSFAGGLITQVKSQIMACQSRAPPTLLSSLHIMIQHESEREAGASAGITEPVITSWRASPLLSTTNKQYYHSVRCQSEITPHQPNAQCRL